MKSINKESLNNIFGFDQSEIYSSDELEELMRSDIFRVKSLIFGIQSFKTMSNLYSIKYSQEFEKVLPDIKFKAFNKLYALVEPVTVSNLTSNKVTFYLDELELIDDALVTLLRYFESEEQYEKCAHLKRIQDTLYGICAVEPSLEFDLDL
jgi:hypothetical protein